MAFCCLGVKMALEGADISRPEEAIYTKQLGIEKKHCSMYFGDCGLSPEDQYHTSLGELPVNLFVRGTILACDQEFVCLAEINDELDENGVPIFSFTDTAEIIEIFFSEKE